MERSSKKQQALLQHIDDFIGEYGYGPSYREMMRALGYKSVSTVAVHVDGLIAKGYLRKKTRSARSLEVVKKNERSETSVAPTPVDGPTWFQNEFAARANDPGTKKSDLKTLLAAAHILNVPHMEQYDENYS